MMLPRTCLGILLLANFISLLCCEECLLPQTVHLLFNYQQHNSSRSEQVNGILSTKSTSSVVGRVFMPSDGVGCNGSYSGITYPWVALVERGVCSFEAKAEQAANHGASGLIVYQNVEEPATTMSVVNGKLSAAMINLRDGLNLIEMLKSGVIIKVTISNPGPNPAAESSDSILWVFTALMSSAALIMNVIAMTAIVCSPEKLKPYLYLIANLVLTDLLVCIIGTAQIVVLYPTLGKLGDSQQHTMNIYNECAADILQEIWDVSILSNMLTLFFLTAEHFIAFRWPLKHKILVTRQRVLMIIALSWVLSTIPMWRTLIADAVTTVPLCFSQSFCYKAFYLRHNAEFSQVISLIWVSVVSVVLLTMVIVYGYIVWIIYRVSIRNPGFRKKKAAMVTTLCLIVSFVLSYIFYYVQHLLVAVEGSETSLLSATKASMMHMCPACPLMLDFLFTGMIGAIMDPIIYCARMKEVKLALDKLCHTRLFSRQRSITSSAYRTAAVNSTHTDTVESGEETM